MNRLAKKSLTASVLLTMILSLMPAINARADGGYTASAIPSKDFKTGVDSKHTSYGMFKISDPDATAAFCMNYTYEAPGSEGVPVSGYIAKTVQPASKNQAAELLDNYAGYNSYSETAKLHGEALYQKVMTVLYYGYQGVGNTKFLDHYQLRDNNQDLPPQREELYRIATQFAIWHYTDENTRFSNKIGQKETFFQNVEDNKLTPDDATWAYKVYSKLVSGELPLPDEFYQKHELTIYVAPERNTVEAKDRPWQNMISVRSIRDREGKDVDFSKVDVNGSKELPGAQLSVTGMDDRGNKVELNWKSDTTAQRFKLYPGSYTMTETQAPTGFQTTTETIAFNVEKVGDDLKIVLKNGENAGKQVDKVVIKNQPSPTVFVSKQDSESHVEIAGAKLKITGHSDGKNSDDKEGENITSIEWTSEAGKSHQVNLYFGTYKLEETNPPTGYETAASITFKVVKDDNDSSKGKIQIEKSKGVFTDFNGNTLVMEDKKIPNTPPTPNTPPDNPKTPPDNPKTPPDNPKTPPDKPSTPPTPTTPPNTPQNPNNGHSAPQVAGAKRNTPGTPGTPGTPVPPSDGGHVPGVAGAQRSPETADATPIALLLGIMSIAAAGLGIFMHKWKKLG